MVKTARCGCAAGGCSCVVIGDPVSAGCIDTVVTGTGSLTDPFIISSNVIIDPNACNLTDCGEAGLITLLYTMESDCIGFSGCGTVASPLTASPIFDPATDDCLNCGPNGFRLVIDPSAGNMLSCEAVSGLRADLSTVDSATIDFSGAGTPASPLTAVIIPGPAVSGTGISAVAVDTDCIDMTVTGDGTLGSPLTISAIPVVDPVTGNQLSCGVNGLLVAPAVSGTGTLGYAEAVSDQGPITTEVDMTGLTVNVVVGTNRRIKITGSTFTQNDNGDTSTRLRIKEGATVLQTRDVNHATANVATALDAMRVLTPSAGPHTYKLTMAEEAGGGSSTNLAAATYPSFILVEDIGAV